MEEVFAQARDAGSEAEELLVDEDWRPVKVGPEAVEVNGNGHHDALEPTVELVPGISHHGNGHDEDADESQRSLFSWAEFMAVEPTKPKGRKSMLQPASMSMFEWALEREREAELVGAGR